MAQQDQELVAQIVRWQICEAIVGAIIGVALIWAALTIFRWAWKKNQCVDGDTTLAVIAFPSIVMFFLGTLLACGGVVRTAQAILAPNILIIETIRETISK